PGSHGESYLKSFCRCRVRSGTQSGDYRHNRSRGQKVQCGRSEGKPAVGLTLNWEPRAAALDIPVGCVAHFQRTRSSGGDGASKGARHPTEHNVVTYPNMTG